MDALVRQTLRNWVSNPQPPGAGKRQLLEAASRMDVPRSLLPTRLEGLITAGRQSLRSAMRAARPDPITEARYSAFECALIPIPPEKYAGRPPRQERWHMFSFGVMVMTLIR
jgi:hypothetical protein